MQSENRPTAQQLLASWQLIWQRKLNGKPEELKEAITSHVNLFPKGNHAEAEARTRRTVAAYSGDPAAIRALIQRGKNRLRAG